MATRKKRTVGSVIRIGILSIAVGILLFAALGPLMSGAVFLLLPSFATRTAHDLPASYHPRHSGHVDLATGLYMREDEDLIVRGTPPLVLRRTYVSRYHVSQAFGVGATHDGEWYLIGDGERFQWASILLGDNRIDFYRTSWGASLSNSMFKAWTPDVRWQGARLGWTGLNWALKRADSSLMVFDPCGPGSSDVCSISRLRDQDGHDTYYRRNASGRVARIESGSDRWIAFEYDDGNRVARAFSSAGAEVRYRYDEGGRLSEAVGSDGVTHRYAYADADLMSTIAEPDVGLENSYDASGRCIRQVSRPPNAATPHVLDLTYAVEDDLITATEIKASDGSWQRIAFDEYRQRTARKWGGGDAGEGSIVYARDPWSRTVTTMTVSCKDGDGKWVKGSAPLDPRGEEWTEDELLRKQSCQLPTSNLQLPR